MTETLAARLRARADQPAIRGTGARFYTKADADLDLAVADALDHLRAIGEHHAYRKDGGPVAAIYHTIGEVILAAIRAIPLEDDR